MMANITSQLAERACNAKEMLSQQLPQKDPNAKDVYFTMTEQGQWLDYQRVECACKMLTEPDSLTGLFCPRVWDGVMCWDDTPADTVATQECPFYINKFTTHGLAIRTCLPNGTWLINELLPNKTEGWTNFTDCISQTKHSHYSEVPNLILKHLVEFRIMYNVGYALSFVCLVFAMMIMIYFKKLHCSRNAIHMNLFVSFIFRAFMNLIRDNFVVDGLGFPKDLVFNDSGGVVGFNEDVPHWECRMFFSIFQYAIIASYFWIFVEAVYIHMLIFVSVFTEKIKVIWYMIFGWSFPVISVLIWSIARLTMDNTLCWNTTKNNPGLTWILQGPIMVTIVINFIFFISLVRVLYTKLNASPEVNKSTYRTLARSALFLIPVFGVYYVVFTLPLHKLSDNMDSVMLFTEMFFNSYQGVFIAVVLCFINTEVRMEIRKLRIFKGLRRGSTSSANARSAKLRNKRESNFSTERTTLAQVDNNDIELPVRIENGNVANKLDSNEEVERFIGNSKDKCDDIKHIDSYCADSSDMDTHNINTNVEVNTCVNVDTGQRVMNGVAGYSNYRYSPVPCDSAVNNNNKNISDNSRSLLMAEHIPPD